MRRPGFAGFIISLAPNRRNLKCFVVYVSLLAAVSVLLIDWGSLRKPEAIPAMSPVGEGEALLGEGEASRLYQPEPESEPKPKPEPEPEQPPYSSGSERGAGGFSEIARAIENAARNVIAGRGDLFRKAIEAAIPALGFKDPTSLRPRNLIDLIFLTLDNTSLSDPRNILVSGLPVLSQVKMNVYASSRMISAKEGDESPLIVTSLPRRGAGRVDGDWPGSAEPLVGIYHTHARESYLPLIPGSRKSKPDDAHTDDLSKTVVAIGQHLAKVLESKYQITSVHSPEVHDSLGKLGAYARSENTVKAMLNAYPSLRVLIDIHRDSTRESDTVGLVHGQRMAKAMLVLGTDNPSWRDNYKFFMDFMDVMESRYPGLCRGIYPQPGRFNQQYSPGAILIEVGGVDNTMTECLRTADAIAEVIAALALKGAIPGQI